MRKEYFIDTSFSVDIQVVKLEGKVTEFYGGVFNRENFKISPFSRVLEKLFALRKK